MSRHGGRIERRIKLSGDPAAPASAGPVPPDEVHIVSFPDAASFARYRADPEITALADLRAAAIRDTVVWQGSEGPAFEALSLPDAIAGADRSRLDHLGADAAQVELASDRRVHELHRFEPEALDELGAAGVRDRGDLDGGGADPEPCAWRQVLPLRSRSTKS